MTPLLRKRDQKIRIYRQVIANSRYTAQEAKELYNLTTSVQYPPIQPEIFTQHIPQEIHDYFIYSWRLVTFVKELDIIIQACNQTNTPLIVMGDGPDKIKLEKIAGNSIIFIPRIKDIYARIQVIQKAKWSINIAKESFGISTMESLLLWVPLLGYNHWATPELVDNKSGILVEDKNIETIAQSLRSRDTRSFNRNYIQEQARKIYKKYSTAAQQ